MRDLKFRVWYREGDWIEEECKFEFQMIYNPMLEKRTINDELLNFNDLQYWMQFTGLTDKNGKEIYEGDILKTKHGSVLHFNDLVECHLWAYRNSVSFTSIEVIGNIYENPKLLK